MKRHFNVNGVCCPGEHYMVDFTNKLKQIKAMVDAGKYDIREELNLIADGKSRALHFLNY